MPRTISTSSTNGPSCWLRKGWPMSTTRRRNKSAKRAAPCRSRARNRRGATARSRRISTCSNECAKASFLTAKRCCVRKSTWRIRTCCSATRSCTASSTPNITERATNGASIRCTTMPTAKATRSNRLPIRSARWNSTYTGRSTTGSSRRWKFSPRISTSLRGWTSPTRWCRNASC